MGATRRPPSPGPVRWLKSPIVYTVFSGQDRGRESSWEKGLLTRKGRGRYLVLMPISGVVHPGVYTRWMSSPAPIPASGRPAPRESESTTAVQPTVEYKPGGTTVSAATTTQVARVLIADDQTLFRSGLAGLLNEDKRVTVVGQAADGAEAVEQASALKPDVVLMDVKMPNLDGVEATRKIVAEHPEIKILILTTFDADTFVLQALRAGASGYVLKDSQPQAIVSSILAVLSGERVMASAVANRVLDMLTGTTTPKDFYNGLTAREIEILKLMATGQANKQIARRLEISEKTVRNHVSHMYEKLQIYERSQAVLYAVRKGLVEL
jgi:DNA-binding NarL/FixJ family response regulator